MRGTPDEATKSQISNEFALSYVEALPFKDKLPLNTLFPDYPAEALDLLDKLLDVNPQTRIEIKDALRHPFLELLHDEEDEPSFEGTIDFSFELDQSLDLAAV